jgi:hypothetical protein
MMRNPDSIPANIVGRTRINLWAHATPLSGRASLCLGIGCLFTRGLARIVRHPVLDENWIDARLSMTLGADPNSQSRACRLQVASDGFVDKKLKGQFSARNDLRFPSLYVRDGGVEHRADALGERRVFFLRTPLWVARNAGLKPTAQGRLAIACFGVCYQSLLDRSFVTILA